MAHRRTAPTPTVDVPPEVRWAAARWFGKPNPPAGYAALVERLAASVLPLEERSRGGQVLGGPWLQATHLRCTPPIRPRRSTHREVDEHLDQAGLRDDFGTVRAAPRRGPRTLRGPPMTPLWSRLRRVVPGRRSADHRSSAIEYNRDLFTAERIARLVE